MNYKFMITSTPLLPCMPLPRATLRLPVSSTAKVMYARLLYEILTRGTLDCNGILFIRFPIMELAAALSRSPQTCKRSQNELEQAGMIMRVRQGIGEASHICVLLSKSELNIIYQYAVPTKAETQEAPTAGTIKKPVPESKCAGRVLIYAAYGTIGTADSWKLHFSCAGSASYPFVDLPPENLSESIFHVASESCIIVSAINRKVVSSEL